MNCISAGPSTTSRATARAITMPKAPESPCKKRKARKKWISSVHAQPRDASVKPAIPMRSGTLRPSRSETGPPRICPTAIPTIVIVSVSCVIEVEMSKAEEISGSEGRYISVDSGAIADMTPRKIVR